MEVKVGQWVRLTNGIILQVDWLDKNNHYDISRNDRYCFGKYGGYITAVADTPRELVQVGDLIGYLDYQNELIIGNVWHKEGNAVYTEVSGWLSSNHITAIYTPNENKTQYTEQWRKE